MTHDEASKAIDELVRTVEGLLEVFVDQPMWNASDRNVRVKQARALVAKIVSEMLS